MSDVNRRDALKILGATATAATVADGCAPTTKHQKGTAMKDDAIVGDDAILAATPLGFPWKTPDPFLFCVHHDDKYPQGNDHMGPAAPLDGRNMGQDFEGKDGCNEYLVLTKPEAIRQIHESFLAVGCDAIETDSFGSNRIDCHSWQFMRVSKIRWLKCQPKTQEIVPTIRQRSC